MAPKKKPSAVKSSSSPTAENSTVEGPTEGPGSASPAPILDPSGFLNCFRPFVQAAVTEQMISVMADLQSVTKATIKEVLAEHTEVWKTDLAARIDARPLPKKFESSMDTMASQLSSALTIHDELSQENKRLAAENKALSVQIRALVSRVEALEREVRDPVSVLYGVPEGNVQGASSPDQPHAVESLIDQTPSSWLVEARRLGKSVASVKQPRPLLLRFATVAHRNAAFTKAKVLRETLKPD